MKGESALEEVWEDTPVEGGRFCDENADWERELGRECNEEVLKGFFEWLLGGRSFDDFFEDDFAD